MMNVEVRPIALKDANAFIEAYHRHHKRVQGHKFSVQACDTVTNEVYAVATVGRPVARGLDTGRALEVTRLCAREHAPKNTVSMLLGAIRRAAQALGYVSLYTYTLAEEHGASLKAAGWVQDAEVYGRSWTCPSRPRTDKHPTTDKIRWRGL